MKLNKSALTLGLGIACIAATIPLTANAAIQSHEKIGLVEWEEGPLPVKEKLKMTWKYWIPPVIMAGLAITNVCMNYSYIRKGEMAAITALNATQTGYNMYKQKMISEVGEDVHNKVSQEIAEDRTKPVTSGEQPIGTLVTYGDSTNGMLCLDAMTGRYFYTTEDKLKNACAEINVKLSSSMDSVATLNDFYAELGLPETQFGDVFGWSLGEDFRNRMFLDIHGCPNLTPDGKACMQIEYNWELLVDSM